MKYPPMLAYLSVQNEEHDFGLWLPLFLAWLLLLALLLALSPLIIIAAIIFLLIGWGNWMWRAIVTFFDTICALHGLKVDVSTERNKIFISVV